MSNRDARRHSTPFVHPPLAQSKVFDFTGAGYAIIAAMFSVTLVSTQVAFADITTMVDTLLYVCRSAQRGRERRA